MLFGLRSQNIYGNIVTEESKFLSARLRVYAEKGIIACEVIVKKLLYITEENSMRKAAATVSMLGEHQTAEGTGDCS